MRLLRVDGDRYQFEMSRRERVLFLALLSRYPMIPLSHHRLSRNSSQIHSSEQSLLEEAMTARRSEFKRRIGQLIDQNDRFRPARDLLHITFTREEIEWLLQVLNDVRVGNWIHIGCPDSDECSRAPTTQEGQSAIPAMELAAYFECQLLEAVDRPCT